MCGIIGLFTRQAWIGDISFESVKPTFVHRGPNDYGEAHLAHAHLGHARLSIQDLSPAGHQPMVSLDGELTIVFNGEIYNFPELRSELQSRGHRFRSHGDTEVLLEAFREWGTACVHRLHGMFAFAIWDATRRKAWLFRDRFGEKPLYYALGANTLIFASELKSMVALLPEEPRLSLTAFDKYLHYQYVPEPETPIEGLVKCPRAHYLELDIDSWRLTAHRYWDVAGVAALDGDPATLVAEKLDEAVRVMMRADVDVGLALSGGIDSGAIATYAAKHATEEVHSFGIGYPGRPASDEREMARTLADQLGIRFHDRELVTSELLDFFPGLIRAIDDPVADIAGFGHYSVAKAAADKGLRVLLTGIGGDELFWGYPWIRDAAARNHEIQRTSPGAPMILWTLAGDFQTAAALRSRIFTEQALEGIPPTNASLAYPNAFQSGDHGNGITELVFDSWLSGNCLSLGDKVAMASSIETRLPFLHVPLVETVLGLRKTRTDFTQGHKPWLVAALRKLMPDSVLARPKRGFEPPTTEWIVSLCQAYPELLTQGVAVSRLGLRPDFVTQVDQHLAYRILVFNGWHEWCVRAVRDNHGKDLRNLLAGLDSRIAISSPTGSSTSPRPSSSEEWVRRTATVLVTFNRPKHTAKVIEALRRANVQDLIVLCDAARDPGEAKAVEETRALVAGIDWTRPTIVHQKTNLGLARSIPQGVDLGLRAHEAVIVLEDDCVPGEHFFSWIHSCLDKYRDRPDVFGISGYSIALPSEILESYPHDAYFYPRMGTWGWATWKDRWEKDIRSTAEVTLRCLDRGIDLEQGGKDIPGIIGDFLNEDLREVWSLPWLLNVYLNEACYVYPTVSHVENIGLDGSGVHGGNTDKYHSPTSSRRAERFPAGPCFDPRIDALFGEYQGATARRFTNRQLRKLAARVREKEMGTPEVSEPPRPRNLSEAFDAADRHFTVGNIEQAILVLEPFLSDEPDQRLLGALGWLETQRGNLRGARIRYQEAVNAQPSSVPALANLAGILIQMGHSNLAEPHLRQILSFRPGDPDAMNALVRLFASEGRRQEARDLAARFCQLHPLRPETPALRDALQEPLDSATRHGQPVLLAKGF